MRDSVIEGILAGIILAILIPVISLLLGWPTMWLLNYLFNPSLLTAVFGISQITFWKAFWFNILIGLLFRSSTSSNKTTD